MLVRDLAVSASAAALTSALLMLPLADRLDALSLDGLFWLRHTAFGQRYAPADSPTVVVAIDEETYRRSPFKELPDVLWTGQITRVLRATLDGGAVVVGLDVIFPASVELFLPRFERDFLLFLREAGDAGQIVLTKVQHGYKPISPFPGYSFAVGHGRNIRAANLYEDLDGIIRRVPLFLRRDGGAGEAPREPSLSLELAARALGASPEVEGGRASLGAYEIPEAAEAGMLVNFDGGSPVPTYSLADLFACAERGDAGYFRRHFAGKVVLLGGVLDVEDRKLTSKRWIAAPEGSGLAERCVHPVPEGFYDRARARDTIPGVYIHAQAVNDLMRRDVPVELNRLASAAITLALVLGACLAAMATGPGRAGFGLAVGALAWVVATTAAFRAGVVLPLADPLLGGGLGYAGLLGYRFAVADRAKRQLRRAFAFYLSPAVIDRMIRSGRDPALGGELRELTVWFSDIESFASLAEELAPAELVGLFNTYLSEMTDIVEAHHGFVDKYIGDAIVAVFGAPLDDPDHARHAVEAALACQARLAGMQGDFGLPAGRRLAARVGVNTGEALVGNIGSRRRFNYTVMGDAVNLAARLEGANKMYGTAILVSESTARACGDDPRFREIDRIRVLGRQAAVRVFEPLGNGVERSSLVARFDAALAQFRARQFAEAAAAFQALSAGDPVAARFAERARAYAGDPPPAGWDGVLDLDRK